MRLCLSDWLFGVEADDTTSDMAKCIEDKYLQGKDYARRFFDGKV